MLDSYEKKINKILNKLEHSSLEPHVIHRGYDCYINSIIYYHGEDHGYIDIGMTTPYTYIYIFINGAYEYCAITTAWGMTPHYAWSSWYRNDICRVTPKEYYKIINRLINILGLDSKVEEIVINNTKLYCESHPEIHMIED